MMSILKNLWGRLLLKNIQFSGNYSRLERLYIWRDPWGLEGATETHRFHATNKIIAQIAPNCARLVELGCGEGLQSKFLTDVCDELVGIDVSLRAINRSKRNVPQAKFLQGKAEELATLLHGQGSDLVLAAEVLYYSVNPRVIIKAAQSVAGKLLVTCYDEQFDRLEPHFKGDGWRELPPITHGDNKWHVHYWERAG